MSQKQKVEKIKEKARELEERAFLKEKRTDSSFYGMGSSNVGATTRGTTVNNQTANVDGTLEANDMLIDAIKAKLAILDTLDE